MSKKELRDFVRENLLDEKIFIVSGITVGKQMVNRMAREGIPSINLKIATLQGLAFEICQEYILKEDKLVIDSVLGNNLIMGILKDFAGKEDGEFFFKKDLIDARTAEEVYKVILELKYSGLKAIPQTKNLDKIYEEYENQLEKLNAVDYCDIISLAIDLDSLEEYKDKNIGVASNVEFHNIERSLFESLTQKNCTRIKMPVNLIDNQPKNYYYKDVDGSQDLDKKNIIFRGQYGCRNEIDYIIQDIKKKRIKLDNLVIAYTNGKYPNLINIEFEKNDIPITYGEGLSVMSSSAYRFIETIFTWANDYYNVNKLKPIFVNGDIKVNLKADMKTSSQKLYEELLKLNIGFARENYIKRLKVSSGGEIVWFREFFEDLFISIPIQPSVNMKDYLSNLTNLINKYVRVSNKYDGAAKIEILDTLNRIVDLDMMVSPREYFDIVISYIGNSKILRSQPQAGHVFASSVKNAGYSGRENLYLIGMDSDSLSNKVIESPILLDLNRKKISEQLSFAKDAYDYKKYKIRELLTAGFKNITILYSNFNTTDVKDKSPSQIYIELKDKYGGTDEETKGKKYEIYGRDLVKSATALETLAECSRKAYLRYKLGLRQKEEDEILVYRWLNPLEKGSMVHEVLNIYFDLNGAKDLLEIVEEESIKKRQEVVVILEDVYKREKEEIISICQSIIERTKKDKEWEVLVNELSFGPIEKGQMKANKVFGALESQKINIMGLDLVLNGSIDRVDVNKNNKNLFRIVDYKTGSKNNFDKQLRVKEEEYDYSATKKLQYYIYKKALEKILEDRKDICPNPQVSNFTYMFKGSGARGVIDLDFSEDFIESIEGRIKGLLDINILEEDKNIIYDPEDDSLSCRYCEFSTICMGDKGVDTLEE